MREDGRQERAKDPERSYEIGRGTPWALVSRMGRACKVGTHLLYGSVLDGVGVVVIVYDFKVPHNLSLGCSSKLHI